MKNIKFQFLKNLRDTKFAFEKKIIGYKSIRIKFENIGDDIINEFIDAMKNMKIFI